MIPAFGWITVLPMPTCFKLDCVRWTVLEGHGNSNVAPDMRSGDRDNELGPGNPLNFEGLSRATRLGVGSLTKPWFDVHTLQIDDEPFDRHCCCPIRPRE